MMFADGPRRCDARDRISARRRAPHLGRSARLTTQAGSSACSASRCRVASVSSTGAAGRVAYRCRRTSKLRTSPTGASPATVAWWWSCTRSCACSRCSSTCRTSRCGSSRWPTTCPCRTRSSVTGRSSSSAWPASARGLTRNFAAFCRAPPLWSIGGGVRHAAWGEPSRHGRAAARKRGTAMDAWMWIVIAAIVVLVIVVRGTRGEAPDAALPPAGHVRLGVRPDRR